MSVVSIRFAAFDDLPAILDIHNDVLINTTAIWKETEDDLAERRAWMSERQAQNFPVIVALNQDQIAGFASYGPWRTRCGYRRTVEHSVHMHRDFRGQGIGTALILRLIELAKADGRHVMLSGISADNEGSLRLHQRLGFYESGRMQQVGFKFGRWLDLVFMQKVLG